MVSFYTIMFQRVKTSNFVLVLNFLLTWVFRTIYKHMCVMGTSPPWWSVSFLSGSINWASSVVLMLKARASHMLGKYSATGLDPKTYYIHFNCSKSRETEFKSQMGTLGERHKFFSNSKVWIWRENFFLPFFFCFWTRVLLCRAHWSSLHYLPDLLLAAGIAGIWHPAKCFTRYVKSNLHLLHF